MGLTSHSVGSSALSDDKICKQSNEKIIALAGNPNVGKSTLFNLLTGMHQHTGNWSGKTVSLASGCFTDGGRCYRLVDLPGTYSLLSHSAEEEVSRDFICFENSDKVIVICDATCLERNLNLVLQVAEITDNVILCINLIDEAKRKGILIDTKGLSERLNIPVVQISARNGKGIGELTDTLDSPQISPAFKVSYTADIESALGEVSKVISPALQGSELNPRFAATRILCGDAGFIAKLNEIVGTDITDDPQLKEILSTINEKIGSPAEISDKMASCIVLTAEGIALDTVSFKSDNHMARDRKIDKILTGKFTGIPVMLCLLLVVFWITLVGANYPSELLTKLFNMLEEKLYSGLCAVGLYRPVCDLLIHGVYKVVAWVIAVMLPPMAIFFPLFTILEDLGYLPRVAFNLDRVFKKCSACGKQALTMCMGFGCNAAGVSGARIIDSPRERLIAVITNCFVPCNGRFPTLIAIIAMFFITCNGLVGSILNALILTLIIGIGITFTFISSKLLSLTILKGMPSSFTLELPPYRKPKIGRVIVSSIFDRTVFVLGRAIISSAPAGLIIWVLANTSIHGSTVLSCITGFLDPFARLFGLDGVILTAFILGLPANEIVVPIMIMAYMSGSTLTDFSSLNSFRELLTANGWTSVTAICVMLFTLMHWPCATTCLTIKKETGSIKWTLLSIVLPTLFGLICCFAVASVGKLFL